MCIVALSCEANDPAEQLVTLTLADTRLCIPQSYFPDTSFMDAMLAPIEDQLDSSVGQVLIEVPGSKVIEIVPEFSPTLTNVFGGKYPNRLMGILYAIPERNGPDPNELAAWTIFQREPTAFVTPDPDSALFRLYEFDEQIGSWSLVREVPAKTPKGFPPEGWYIGFCGENATGYDCKLRTPFQSVDFRYTVDQQDLHLAKDIHGAVRIMMQRWQDACGVSG
jgi:hypothetical protein